MFLKTLTLKGFKSFAESTMFEFEPGTTVVVGPNGSGKSNVVDAIGWVLGSQAPSAVRSQKMDDVIFAGSGNRPALGRAEVALTVDNSAGLLPIAFSEVTITRTLFRGGDSEYAINGVPCRLLDVQELMSDTGVGRQQHVIVSQGQIDAILNARPEDRRLVIEEAAGVLKYRRRKEKAERRLAATEANMIRLQDLLREVRRQLRPLERQAEAARRHGDVVAELAALRTFLTGRELASLRARLDRQAAQRIELASSETGRKRTLAGLDTDVIAAESELSAVGGDDLSELAGRFESQRERARGLAALIAERRRSVGRERERFVDGSIAAGLETEADGLRGQLVTADAEAADLAGVKAMVSDELSWLEAERSAFDTEATTTAGAGATAATPADAEATVSVPAAEIRGELGALRAAVDQAAAGIDDDRHRLVRLEARRSHVEVELGDARRAAAQAATEAPDLERAATHARRALDEARARVESADADLRRAEAEHHRWTARVETMTQALDAARARAGAERLAGLDGVIGTLLELVDVDPGYEAAFEAAIGEAMDAIVVESTAAARRAIGALRQGDVAGAVLPLAAGSPPPDDPPPGDRLRTHVRSTRSDVERLLDALLRTAVVVDGWEHAVALASDHPTAVVVTRDGDRFAPTGWRVGRATVGATGAALDDAIAREAAAAAALAPVRDAADRAASALIERQEAVVEAGDRFSGNERRMTGAAEAVDRLEHQDGELTEEIASFRARVDERSDRVAKDQGRVAQLEARLAVLEADEAAAAEQHEIAAAARHRVDQDIAAAAARRADLDIRLATVGERRAQIARRLGEIDGRLARLAAETTQAAAQTQALEATAMALSRLGGAVETQLGRLESELVDLRARRQQRNDANRLVADRLDDLRRRRAAEEAELEAARERSRRAELDEAETRLRLEQAVERCRHDLDVEPAEAQAATCPPLADGVTPQARVRELERDLRLMGPINPLAVEEHAALLERHEFAVGQLDDVKSSRRELAKIIATVDEEIVNVFAAAYADVAENFARLFDTLFPGGRGRLSLTQPDNLLDTGIDVEARPSGKNVKKLSLLSGGERSLTALAFLFAVFRSRPSPFYVLDEVEAALDDVNLHRFLDLVAEFRREAQLLIVSHQKRTMEAADCLYGITMQPGGSSRAISERMSAVV